MSNMRDPKAYLFICRPEIIVDRQLLARYEQLLDPVEEARFRNFENKKDAHTFLVAHALVRTALSCFVDIPPSAWRFRFNPFGRPEVENDGSAPEFNLTHCRGLVACLLTSRGYCGVDVEEIRNFEDLHALAEDFFAPSEVAAMATLPKELLLERFFSLWTLKEAYAKARGIGLSLPLNCAEFGFDGDRISFHSSESPDHSHQWTFTLMRPAPSHLIATAVPDQAPLSVVANWFTPLAGWEAVQSMKCIASTRRVGSSVKVAEFSSILPVLRSHSNGT